MKAKGIFISTVLIIDTFFVSFAVGFNSRSVPVLDPKLKKYTPPKIVQPADTDSHPTNPQTEKVAPAVKPSKQTGNKPAGSAGKAGKPASKPVNKKTATPAAKGSKTKSQS